MKPKLIVLSSFTLLIAVCGCITPALSNEAQDKRNFFYFMAAVNGDSERLGKFLNVYREEYKNRLGQGDTLGEQADGIRIQTVNQFMEYNPRSESNINELWSNFEVALPSKYNNKVNLSLFVVKALLSGSVRAPPYYQGLADAEVEKSKILSENLSYFSVLKTTARLAPADEKAIDLAFKYYTGKSFSTSDENITNDPLMKPYVNRETLLSDVSRDLSLKIDEITSDSDSKFQNITKLLEISAQNDIARKQHLRLNNAQTTSDLEAVIRDAQTEKCQGATQQSCENRRAIIVTATHNKIEQIKADEVTLAVGQTIVLGLAISQLTGDDNLHKTFRALSIVNSTFQNVLKAVDSYRSASTAWGQYASIAMASTSVIGAFSVLSSLSQSNTDRTQEILKSLDQIKEMISDLSEQIAYGFDSIDTRLAGIENYIKVYNELNNKVLSGLVKQLHDIESEVRDKSQFIGIVELSYKNNANKIWRSLREKYYSIILSSPENEEIYRNLHKAITEYFTISDFVLNGEYGIGIKRESIINSFSSVVENLAQYKSGPFQTAFLLQTIATTSNLAACEKLNLIGYKVTSTAAEELNRILAKLDHKHIGEFLSQWVDTSELSKQIKQTTEFNNDQRSKMKSCFLGDSNSLGLIDELEGDYNRALLQFVENRENEFFNDSSNLNNLLVLKPNIFASFDPPGGFSTEHFKLGHLISASRSFRAQDWENETKGVLVNAHSSISDGKHNFQLDQRFFEKLVPDFKLRLAHLAGVPVNYEFYHWFQEYNQLYIWIQQGEINFDIVLTVPKAKKVVHIWRWTVNKTDIDDLLEQGQVPSSFKPWPAVRIGKNNAKTVYDRMVENETFMSSLMRSNYSLWICKMFDDALLDCRHKKSSGWLGTECRRFVHEHYFTGRVNNNPKPTAYCDAYPAPFFNAIESFNTYRKEFVSDVRSYVNKATKHATQIMAHCLWNSMSTGKCDRQGMVVSFGSVVADRNYIQNVALMRQVVLEFTKSRSGIVSTLNKTSLQFNLDRLLSRYSKENLDPQELLTLISEAKEKIQNSVSTSPEKSKMSDLLLSDLITHHGFDQLGTTLLHFINATSVTKAID